MNENTQPLLYNTKAAMARASKSRASLNRWVKQGLLPTGFYVNGHRHWLAEEFDEALKKLAANTGGFEA